MSRPTPRRIRALVFDFDGLILDTETPVFESWRVVYEEAGHELSLSRWQQSIGTDGSSFDALAELQQLVGQTIDIDRLQRRRRQIRDADLAERLVLPGVEAALANAHENGLKLAVASSSPADWVRPHLDRLGLLRWFDAIATREDVPNAKPAPDLYLRATSLLDVAPGDSIAFEDSPNGVTAAKSAGLYCVAVPGPMTRSLRFDHADHVAPSLAAATVDEWITTAQRRSDPD